MTTTTTRREIFLEAASVRWGKAHCRSLTFPANTANVLAGLYLPINYMGDDLVEVNGYVWFNDMAASDPAPAGLTLITPIDVASGDSAAVVAASFQLAINTSIDPKIVKVLSVTSATAVLENKYIGAITAETDPDTTGVTNTVIVAGVGLDLGDTAEGIELAMEVSTTDINSNQKGGLVLDSIYQGSSASISMSLLELNKERFELLVGQVTGDTVTPAGGTTVTGYGESRLFQSLLNLGGQLILHPIRLAANDRSRDVIFWKSAPVPTSINYDGTAAQVMAVDFVAYLDTTKKTAINLFLRGDWTQDGLDA
jgi:hypothetical protein